MPYERDTFFDAPEWVLISSAFNVNSGGVTALLDIPPTEVKNYGVSAWAQPDDGPDAGGGFVTMAMTLADTSITQAGLDPLYYGPHALNGPPDGNGTAQMVMADHVSDFPPFAFVRLAIGRASGGGGVIYSYELFAEVPSPGGGGSNGDSLPGVGCERPPWPYSVELGGSEGDWGVVRFKHHH